MNLRVHGPALLCGLLLLAGVSVGAASSPPENSDPAPGTEALAKLQVAAARGDKDAQRILAEIRLRGLLRGDDPGTGPLFQGTIRSAGDESAIGGPLVDALRQAPGFADADAAIGSAPARGETPAQMAERLFHRASTHPTVLTALLDGHQCPVVKVAGTDPIVRRDRKEKRIRTEPVYFTERAQRFAPGFVMIDKLDLESLTLKSTAHREDSVETGGGAVGGVSYCRMTLTAAQELRGAFVVVLIFNADFALGRTDLPKTTYLVHDLPTLAAGRAVPIDFSYHATQGDGVRYGIPLIFAEGGAEVVTNYSRLAKDYFARLEATVHAAAVRDYRARFPAADHPPEPFLRVDPMLPAATAAPAEPAVAVLSIDAMGCVSDVKIDTPLSPERAAALNDALRCWRFLPKLKAGQPVATRVQLPLSF
jgi:hypothetical protein